MIRSAAVGGISPADRQRLIPHGKGVLLMDFTSAIVAIAALCTAVANLAAAVVKFIAEIREQAEGKRGR